MSPPADSTGVQLLIPHRSTCWFHSQQLISQESSCWFHRSPAANSTGVQPVTLISAHVVFSQKSSHIYSMRCISRLSEDSTGVQSAALVQEFLVKVYPCAWFSFRSPVRTRESSPQSTHRVATAAFWLTLDHEGKISPVWWGWKMHAYLLFTIFSTTYKVAVYAPQSIYCRGTDEIGGVYLPSQLERTLQLCTWC
jgi:hypothetical protein